MDFRSNLEDALSNEPQDVTKIDHRRRIKKILKHWKELCNEHCLIGRRVVPAEELSDRSKSLFSEKAVYENCD